MKHVFFAILSLCSLAVLAATPTAADLKEYYSAGEVCVCIQFAEPVCNDIVWCGTYNGWSTNVKNLAKFQAIKNFEGWYVVSFTDNNSDVRGKAVQLRSDGSFNWKYQTGNDQSWTIVSGSATIYASGGESELRNISKSTPLIAISSKWKNNTCTSGNAYSGTLPVLYINTENKTPITSKETYINATYYLDNLGLTGYTSIASNDMPDTMQIKGRGNYTWKDFDKKPYRIKLNKKTALMGLEKSKHWTLLAHADDQFCWMKNTVGFLLSEQIGLEWTPKQAPVEVVLNGDYIGLYMLTEQVRLDDKRVQGDWLVEIDNYQEAGNIELVEPINQWHNEQLVWITPKDPDASELNTDQHNYLQGQMDTLNLVIYGTSDQQLSTRLDIDEAARFYLVQELMSDCESYHGSCYLYQNVNENQKWRFGPVWDFGNSFRDENKFIYDKPYFSQIWIGELANHQIFKDSLNKVWKEWKSTYYNSINSAIDSFANLIAAAANADAERWPKYDHSNVQQGKTVFKNYFRTHVNWLTTQWGDATQLEGIKKEEQGLRKVMLDGQLYIIRNEKVYTIMGSGTSIGKLPR